MGGEDTSFSLGSAVTVVTTAAHFRSGYARCSIYQITNGAISKSSLFPGGAVSSAWLSCRSFAINPTTAGGRLAIGFGDSAGNSGLFLGIDTATGAKLTLSKYNGATTTQLATESGTSLSAVLQRMDMQVVGPLNAVTVNVYLDGVLLITYTGDISAIMTDFDSVYIARSSGGQLFEFSEIMVADDDTRSRLGLLTFALTGDGTTTDWTGAYSTINGTTISDASPNYTNTNDLDQEFDVTNQPTGTFAVEAIKLEVRAAKAAGTPTQIALGYNEGGTVTVEGDIALTTSYATYEQLDLVNPRTAAAWDASIINALQINARSKA